jgi:hypothetical protein
MFLTLLLPLLLRHFLFKICQKLLVFSRRNRQVHKNLRNNFAKSSVYNLKNFLQPAFMAWLPPAARHSVPPFYSSFCATFTRYAVKSQGFSNRKHPSFHHTVKPFFMFPSAGSQGCLGKGGGGMGREQETKTPKLSGYAAVFVSACGSMRMGRVWGAEVLCICESVEYCILLVVLYSIST